MDVMRRIPSAGEKCLRLNAGMPHRRHPEQGIGRRPADRDPAADTVGRSYNRGKILEEYEQEILEGAGTHYAPFLADLFRRQEVRDDMAYLLGVGRDSMYRELYTLLRNNSKS